MSDVSSVARWLPRGLTAGIGYSLQWLADVEDIERVR